MSSAWLSSHLSDGKLLSPVVFRLCNHFFLEFLGVMFRYTPIPRTAHLAPDLFETHALWWSGLPWLHHPPEPWPISCPSVPSDSLEQCPEPPVCALHSNQIGISRRVILRSQNCYELLLICTVFSIDSDTLKTRKLRVIPRFYSPKTFRTLLAQNNAVRHVS